MSDMTPESQPARTSASWMITFADLVSLLLAFFVLLFAMSNVKTEKWQAVIETLSERLNPDTSRQRPVPAADFSVKWLIDPERLDLDYATAVVRDKLMSDAALAGVSIRRLKDRLVITLPGESLFEPRSARLTPDALQTTFMLAEILRNADNRVDVNGYFGRDADADGTVSKWQISAMRAIAVARAIRRAGLSRSITAYGLADTGYSELPASLSEERRKQLAGRVDIVIREGSDNGDRGEL